MRIKLAEKKATLVLLNASASSSRFVDAMNISRLIKGEDIVPAMHASMRRRSRSAKV